MSTLSRVLVIDDDKRIRESVCLVLESHGFQVAGARDGDQGIELNQKTPFDVAIIDMFMPNKDGIETIRNFTDQFPNLRIIAISGGGENFLSMAQRFGAVATLSKPFEGQDLIDTIKRVAENG